MLSLMKRTYITAALALGVLLPAGPALAGPYTDELSKALVERTTSQEKIVLVRWIFSALASHPDVKSMAQVTPQKRAEINKEIASMMTSLLTERCVNETRNAIKYEGGEAITAAFQVFGQVAAREIFSHPSVNSNLSEIEKYMDMEKFKKAFGEDGRGGKR